MKVSYLVYTGNKTGNIIARKEHPTSPWRNIAIYPGWKKQIGVGVPPKVAKGLVDMLSHSFHIESEELDNLAEVKVKIFDLLQIYEKSMDEDSAAVLPALVIEALLDMYGEKAIITISTAIFRSGGLNLNMEGRVSLIKEAYDSSVTALEELEKAGGNEADFGSNGPEAPATESTGQETSGESAAVTETSDGAPVEEGEADKTGQEEGPKTKDPEPSMTGEDTPTQPEGDVTDEDELEEEEEEEELDDEPSNPDDKPQKENDPAAGKTSRRKAAPKKTGSRRRSPASK